MGVVVDRVISHTYAISAVKKKKVDFCKFQNFGSLKFNYFFNF